MKVHFIAIGGSAMHNLALALQHKGYEITGSDDIIYEPSKSRLADKGLLPQEFGWYKDINCIESIDTSNPVMAALEDVAYSNQGLISKPKANMNDYFYMLDSQVDYDLLDYNLAMFRKINNL